MKREAILSPLLILTVIGGLLPLGAASWWLFELVSHFRVQYVAVAIPMVLVAVALRQRLLALLLAATAVLNALPLLPYLTPAQSAPSANAFSVVNVNVNSDNREYGLIIDSIRSTRPDVIAILELTPALDRATLDLTDLYPSRFSVPANDNFGIGVYSRQPLLATTAFSIGPTTAIDSTVELPTARIRFLAVHLVPPMSAELAATRNRQLVELTEYAAEIDEPLVICGDFNLTPYSPFFELFTAAAGLRHARLGQGIGISWPTFLPLAGIPIDHCFVRGPLTINRVERLDRMGSDHYPVLTELAWQSDQ